MFGLDTNPAHGYIRLPTILGDMPSNGALARAFSANRISVLNGQPPTARPTLPLLGHGAQLQARRLASKAAANAETYGHLPRTPCRKHQVVEAMARHDAQMAAEIALDRDTAAKPARKSRAKKVAA